MTNQLAIILGVIFAGLIIADVVLNQGAALLFLGKKLLELIAYMAFWH